MAKIYTKFGDKGQTYLADGVVTLKSDHRVSVYGCIDELNSHLGLLRSFMLQAKQQPTASSLPISSEELESGWCFIVQNELFCLGSELSCAGEPPQSFPLIEDKSITRLESQIDILWAALPPLKNFILPGGGFTASQAHICRTVCRRTERHIWLLNQSHTVRPEASKYFNRLSDWFFALARYGILLEGSKEISWQKNI